MAYLECHYFSFVLGNNVGISVVIPTPEGNEQITDKKFAVTLDCFKDGELVLKKRKKKFKKIVVK